MFKRTVVLLAAVALMGAGCWGTASTDVNVGGSGSGSGAVTGGSDSGSGATGGSAVDTAAAAKIQGSWKMVAFKKPTAGEKLQDVSKLNLTLTLGADGKLSAKFCNSMSGGYSYRDGLLTGPQLVSTLMFCEGLPGEIEAAFLSDITVGATANAADGGLTMIGTKTLNVYTFAKQ